MSSIYKNIANFASSLLSAEPPRGTAKKKSLNRKRKLPEFNEEAASNPRNKPLRGDLDDLTKNIDERAHTTKRTKLTKETREIKKVNKVNDIKINGAKGADGTNDKPLREKPTPPSDPTQNTELKVLEEIYRDIFERIEGRTGIISKDLSLEWKKNLEAIEDEEAHFVESFKLVTSLVVDARAMADINAAFVVIKGAFWSHTQLSEDRSRALKQSYFKHPIHKNVNLSVAILYSKISPEITHETGRTLIRQWQRYSQTAKELDWKTLAILSFSASFRDYALVATDAAWKEFSLRLRDLRISIQLAGDFFCSDWRKLVDMALEGSVPSLNLIKDDYRGHHHLWVVPFHDKKATAAQPVTISYKVLEKSVYGADVKFSADPRIIKNNFPALEKQDVFRDICHLCMETKCECPSSAWFPCRVELIQTGERGIGVRILQSIRKDQVLGEYVGELTGPQGLYKGDRYLLGGYKHAYCVTSNAKGNWTRFANHACRPNCRIAHIPWRGRILSVYKANRNIEMLEEITISYGKSYFATQKAMETECLCPEEFHITNPQHVSEWPN